LFGSHARAALLLAVSPITFSSVTCKHAVCLKCDLGSARLGDSVERNAARGKLISPQIATFDRYNQQNVSAMASSVENSFPCQWSICFAAYSHDVRLLIGAERYFC
jgi:hypothetical protein